MTPPASVASGRTRQKERTREQLLAAARRLIASGDTPRIDDVAEASGISRTTAYRYFRTPADLLAAALRQGRAVAWFVEALEPLRDALGDAALRQLAVAFRSVCGIESRVWLKDIAQLKTDQVRALQLWISQALVARAADDPPPTPGSKARRRRLPTH